MHTVELLEQALGVAEVLGYAVRHEWLGGGTGGACEVAGKRWLFVDLALNPYEQLDQVLQALQSDQRFYSTEIPFELCQHLGIHRARRRSA